MTQNVGLQSWDASGNSIFDSTKRTPRIKGKVTFNAVGVQTGYFDVSYNSGESIGATIVVYDTNQLAFLYDAGAGIGDPPNRIRWQAEDVAGYIIYWVYS